MLFRGSARDVTPKSHNRKKRDLEVQALPAVRVLVVKFFTISLTHIAEEAKLGVTERDRGERQLFRAH